MKIPSDLNGRAGYYAMLRSLGDSKASNENSDDMRARPATPKETIPFLLWQRGISLPTNPYAEENPPENFDDNLSSFGKQLGFGELDLSAGVEGVTFKEVENNEGLDLLFADYSFLDPNNSNEAPHIKLDDELLEDLARVERNKKSITDEAIEELFSDPDEFYKILYRYE